MTDIILHAYDASPFTQRVLRMFGFKGLEWRWVETPMMPPKDDLVALTGGYRGTPVLQMGRDVYIDSQLIAVELERRFPQPSLFPGGNAGLSLALDDWSIAFFRAGLTIVLATSRSAWPEAFRKDREYLFPDIEFEAVDGELDYARSQYRAHAWLLERQLEDGRPFLGGQEPGLMDVNAHPFVWMMRGALPAITAELLNNFPRLMQWEARVAERGEGKRVATTAEAASHAIADAPLSPTSIDPKDAQSLVAGMRVRVSPEPTRRGDVEGVVHAASPNEIVVARSFQGKETVLIHFPRRGYRVIPLEASTAR